METHYRKKDLLGIEELSRGEIEHILEIAKSFREVNERAIKKVPTLRGKTIVSLFYEPSTRTKMSFEIAAKRLSADTYSISTTTSSMVKGETFLDTIKNLEAMKPDVFIIRHSQSGIPHRIASITPVSVINAGDGQHEHPSQALLDLLTVLDHRGSVEGLELLIVGDVLHSRVARSNIWAFTKMGAKVTLCGPPTLLPLNTLEKLFYGTQVKVTYDLDGAIPEADVLMVLRLQLERQKLSFFPSLREYSLLYGINSRRLQRAKKDLIVMHPGPINRGVELSSDVIDGARSVILDQVTNGVSVRMAILYILAQRGSEL
ncbi:MAG: aspartate carbamoyltransferase catalytic subunit [Syntrophobacterales bacterium]|nr:aspartate carbamoyltransferase catalytic subunit [Syntrophobacterales bacterium]